MRLACEMQLNGEVRNAADGVHIRLNTEGDDGVNSFINSVIRNHPSGAKITDVKATKIPFCDFKEFKIITSSTGEARTTYISPDLGTCSTCFSELYDNNNHRYRYPFITCTDCGPRFSIVRDIPFDRENTDMNEFIMCERCKTEYESPDDRRFHSQTNSCRDCGIVLHSDTYSCHSQDELVRNIIYSLRNGEIIALKGTGGFLLLCDATNGEAIRKLRSRKQRPSKPFAVLYPDINLLNADADLNPIEINALNDPVFPILLVKSKQNPGSGIQKQLIAPESKLLGVMLPNSPLLSMVASDFGKPIIATSANISGSPILFTEEQVKENLSHVYDHIISHNRKISQPQDDSVWRFSPLHQTRIIIRRSRGMAPAYWQKCKDEFPPTLAAGADLKSSFGIAGKSQIYLSQYSGDLSGYQNQLQFTHILKKYLHFTALEPEYVVTDLHPDYYSAGLVAHISAPKMIKIQHHKAHFAACLLEHDFLHSHQKCLGIIWDGMGYGEDRQIWGGEFFTYQNYEMQRAGHFDYFPYMLGDKMSVQPRLSALALLSYNHVPLHRIQHKFSEQEYNLYLKILSDYAGPRTSSVGRIFDALACLLGCGDINSFEGQSAMALEQLAFDSCPDCTTLDSLDFYPIDITEKRVYTSRMIHSILADLDCGFPAALIAAKFHKSLVFLVKAMAENQNCKHLFFSGGVFQNGLLVDMMQYFLGEEFYIHFHEAVSPNDENIALGQIASVIMVNQNELLLH